MRRPLLFFSLLACNGGPGDTAEAEPTVVLAPPGTTPEVGEIAEYDALFVNHLPERVEWFVDGERVSFEPLSGQERATLELVTPAESFNLRVDAFSGVESVSDDQDLEGTPNTAPVVTLTSPTTTSAAVDDVVEIIATVEDVTDGETDCVALVNNTEVRAGVADNGGFGATWIAVAGTWTLAVSCTDPLDALGNDEIEVVVQ